MSLVPGYNHLCPITPPRKINLPWSPSPSAISPCPSTPEPLDATRRSRRARRAKVPYPTPESTPTRPSSSKSRNTEKAQTLPARRRSNDPDYVPRPANAFVLFRASLYRQLKSQNIENDQRHYSQISSAAWKNLGEEERTMWYERAAEAKKAHEEKYPDYRYQPAVRNDKPRRRNVKRNGPKDKERSQKLGELFSQGKSPEELEREASKIDAEMRENGQEEDTVLSAEGYLTTVFNSKSRSNEHAGSSTRSYGTAGILPTTSANPPVHDDMKIDMSFLSLPEVPPLVESKLEIKEERAATVSDMLNLAMSSNVHADEKEDFLAALQALSQLGPDSAEPTASETYDAPNDLYDLLCYEELGVPPPASYLLESSSMSNPLDLSIFGMSDISYAPTYGLGSSASNSLQYGTSSSYGLSPELSTLFGCTFESATHSAAEDVPSRVSRRNVSPTFADLETLSPSQVEAMLSVPDEDSELSSY